MKKQHKKIKNFKPVNVLTVFLSLVVIGIVVGYLLMFLNDNYGFAGSDPIKVEDYTIEIIIEDYDNLNQFSIGTKFNVTGKNTYFGSVASQSICEENSNDLCLYLNAVGTYSREEGFKLNGNLPISSGETLKIHNGPIEYNIEIKSIEKAK